MKYLKTYEDKSIGFFNSSKEDILLKLGEFISNFVESVNGYTTLSSYIGFDNDNHMDWSASFLEFVDDSKTALSITLTYKEKDKMYYQDLIILNIYPVSDDARTFAQDLYRYASSLGINYLLNNSVTLYLSMLDVAKFYKMNQKGFLVNKK